MKPKAVTIKDVAAAANVSRATAARALNGYGYVGGEAAERVRRVARELGYRGNRIAQALRQGELPLVGFIPGDILNPFFSQIAHDLDMALRGSRHNLLIAASQEDPAQERQVIDSLRALAVRGLIIAPASSDRNPQLEEMHREGYPMVLIDRVPEGLDCDQITVDNRKGARGAVEYLIRQGHRRIALIHDDSRIGTARDRLAGYREALEAHGLPADESLIIESPSTVSHAIDATIRLFRRQNPPTALFTVDSLITQGAMLAFRSLGLSMPHDVSLAGFDDFDMATFSDPQITVVSQPIKKIGPLAVEMVMARIQGSRAPARHVQFPTQLTIRGSVSRPRGS
ncbi:LacI family DNA-binding transcriptional regulator [Poseidonocella sp. HB161398]|uniref:LacI family DNA-binding transcriptional regulator n=1 Tax=Poseidonocella sp. HB161398 TaxID=2320855 RepID=UPI001108811B|nr:LacI family DNA-binding transcriptional regulator [Poseidonocella sp. HB161398]